MPIDLIYLIVLGIGAWKGYQKGLVVSVFSFFSLVIGLAVSLRFSATIADALYESVNDYVDWFPFLGFILVFATTVAIIRFAAQLLKEAVTLLLLGWLDKLGGILLYCLLYTLIFSSVLFFLFHLHILNQLDGNYSWVYLYLYPVSKVTLHLVGAILPYCKNAFQQLEYFFARVPH